MILLAILRKVLLSLVPLALFYLSRKMAKGQTKGKLNSSDFEKSRIIDGEIIKEKK